MSAIKKYIEELVEQLGGQETYKTLVIGVLAGDKVQVQVSEREFDKSLDTLLCSHLFTKLSGFTGLKDPKLNWNDILSIVHQSIQCDMEQGSSDESITEKWRLVVEQSIGICRDER